ncbi:unnamed protein product [Clonostachys solani]|uniref:Uncharacterized protein n=1 Tax=Clonostachys solani TaxID=160281 RepID=A0A9P0EPY4_9HYPO|nr:unnamed protein product [Clonostachys solani]
MTSSSCVKWIISSRNWQDIEEKLENVKQKVRFHLELNKDLTSTAVRIYIRHKVEALVEQKKYNYQMRDASTKSSKALIFRMYLTLLKKYLLAWKLYIIE